MEKLIITVTVDSSMSYPGNPNMPAIEDTDAVAAEYIRSVDAGASLVHHHGVHYLDKKMAADGRQLFLRNAKRDGLFGLLTMVCAAGAVDPQARAATIAAMAGAALLDADKPAVHYFGRNPFPRAVRRIHARAQNESSQGMPNEIAFGLLCAITDAVIAVNGRRRYSAVC